MDEELLDNYNAATKDLNLNEQEQYLYQTHLANLWGKGGMDNADGSRSTLYASVEPRGSGYSVIPTIWDGKRETEQWTRPSDGKNFDVPNSTALANVDKIGWDKFPSYSDPDTAEKRYLSMHDYMGSDTQAYQSVVK